MPAPVIQRVFAGGELAPALHGRADQVKYASGLRTCRNFLVLKSGGVANRPGLRFIAACKTTDPSVQLLRYVSELPGESVLIEAGNGYLRFFKDGAPLVVSGAAAWAGGTAYVQGDLVTHGGVTYYARAASTGVAPPAAQWYALTGDLYEVPSPFGSEGLFYWVQAGRVITMTHPSAPPHELHYLADLRWVVVPIVTQPALAAPTGLAGTAGAAGARTFAYQVTAAKAEDYEESLPSAVATIPAAAAPTETAPHVLTWDAVPGAVEYYIYADPYANQTFGFIGTATGVTSFRDVGFVPDFDITPPIARALFTAPNTYPAVAGYHQQRRFFAYTDLEPDAVYASRTGFPSNFGISSPLQDDDALTFRLAGNTHHPVRHLVGLKQLVILTDGGGWTVGAAQTPLTPTNLPAEQVIYVGSHDKKPVVVGNTVVYVEARGRIVRDLRFDQAVEGFAGRDLTIYASHLFEHRAIGRIDYAHTPHSIIWCTEGGSRLLGLTYIPEQEVWGWHRHDSGAGAQFDDVCVVPERDRDALYVIVRRTIQGADVRYIERLEPREIDPGRFDEEVFFVDSGLTYDGPPVTAVSGLDHLEGEVVAVVGDGAVIFDGDPAAPAAADYTVSGGIIELPTACAVVHVGLRIAYPDLETLDLDVQGAEVRDKKKKVQSLTVLVDQSSRAFWAGPDAAHLRHVKVPPWSPAVDAHTGQVEINLTSTFDHPGRVFIRQTAPLPLTILGVIPHVELGG